MKEDTGYEAVMGITGRRTAVGAEWDSFIRPGIIGVDEISLKKGHNDSVTVIISYDGRVRTSGIVRGREKAGELKFFTHRGIVTIFQCMIQEGYSLF
ncbi:MAG: transposase [Desulfobacteraceae bacterium]|nr:transposase [Desulfobacteraceae bacterium]